MHTPSRQTWAKYRLLGTPPASVFVENIGSRQHGLSFDCLRIAKVCKDIFAVNKARPGRSDQLRLGADKTLPENPVLPYSHLTTLPRSVTICGSKTGLDFPLDLQVGKNIALDNHIIQYPFVIAFFGTLHVAIPICPSKHSRNLGTTGLFGVTSKSRTSKSVDPTAYKPGAEA